MVKSGHSVSLGPCVNVREPACVGGVEDQPEEKCLMSLAVGHVELTMEKRVVDIHKGLESKDRGIPCMEGLEMGNVLQRLMG